MQTTDVLCNYEQAIHIGVSGVCKQKQSECPFRNTFKGKLLLCSNQQIDIQCK